MCSWSVLNYPGEVGLIIDNRSPDSLMGVGGDGFNWSFQTVPTVTVTGRPVDGAKQQFFSPVLMFSWIKNNQKVYREQSLYPCK